MATQVMGSNLWVQFPQLANSPMLAASAYKQPCSTTGWGVSSSAMAFASTRNSSCTTLDDRLTQKERQELLWQHFFLDPVEWWDNRAENRSSASPRQQHPDFRHKTSRLSLWLDSSHKPDWVDSQLARWDQGRRPEELLRLSEAVEALDVLVQRGWGRHVTPALFCRLLKRGLAQNDLAFTRRLHSLAVASGHGSNAFLANHMIGMYAAHGKLEDAMQAFSQVPVPDVFMWSSIILAHARHGQPAEGIKLYREMQELAEVEPDNRLYVAALTACAAAQDLPAGKQVHADIQASAGKADIFLGNSLVNMYAKCGSVVDAREVFDTMPRRDVVTWTAMIKGCTQQGLGRDALALYTQMQQEGVTPANRVTYMCLLQACANVGALQQGKELHLKIREKGLEADAAIGNSLVNMYAKCGSLEDACAVFDSLPRRDVVTWTAMIAGYSQRGLGQDALALYSRMQLEGITPANHVTFVCLLQACASVAALQQGKQLHSQIRERGLEADEVIGNCLVNMYAKCGSLEDARRVFDRLPTRDLVTWTALLTGYAEHGDGHMAIRCFEGMLQQGVEPDDTTFTCLFVACSHAGLVHQGQRYFRMMVEDYGIVPTDKHYSCMVDLLGRSGQLEEAESMLRSRSFVQDVVGWTALLTACKSYGDVERGRRCFDHLLELEADDASSYVLLENIYAKAGRWDDVDRIENLRKMAGITKKAAKACIEVQNEVHEFTVGEDRSDISSKLRSVNMRLKEEGGHVPQTQLVLKAMSEEKKEDALCGHAEKLALAYGLLNTPDGTTLVVTKNLRMCNDCHSSTKIMSRLEKREIIVRDAHRVHRFLDGACSCRDRH